MRRQPPCVDDIGPSQVTVVSTDKFCVRSRDRQYEVVISGTVPSCQCSDWDRNFSPRKHIPSVVRDFGWDCLPQQYRNLPVFVLDRDIVGDVSSHTLSQSAVADTVMESCRFASDVETDNDVAVSQLAVADTVMLKVLLKVHQSQQ